MYIGERESDIVRIDSIRFILVKESYHTWITPLSMRILNFILSREKKHIDSRDIIKVYQNATGSETV